MKQLILDLVDNGGGYMQPAVEILGEFLEPDASQSIQKDAILRATIIYDPAAWHQTAFQ